MADLFQFIKVGNPKDLLQVLKSRHPHSCFIQNQVITSKNLNNSLFFYTIGHEINPNTWILTNHICKDYGSFISISAPPGIVIEKEPIPLEIKNAFANCEIINWNEDLIFVPMEKPVSRMIFDISVNEKGNVTVVHPCNFYYMEVEDALKREILCPTNVIIRRLCAKNQDESFIASTWKYTRAGSEQDIRKSLEACASAGVFVDGKCVSGVYMSGYGLISSLYSLKQYRNKGFGKLAMNYILRECAKDGCIPSFAVERKNTRSAQFNEGLGVKLLSQVEWIQVKKLEED